MGKEREKFNEQRKYLRLDTVFPVQFRLEDLDGKTFLSSWLQGFTNNISRGGICLSINNISADFFELLKERKCKLSLEIDVPFSKKAISAQASIVWFKEILGEKNKCLLGLSYDRISGKHNKALMRYGWSKKLFIPTTILVVFVLALILGVNSYLNFTLTRNNKLLIEKLAVTIKDSDLAKQKIREVSRMRQDLESKLKALENNIKSIEQQKTQIEAGNLSQIKQLNEAIKVLISEKKSLESRLSDALRSEDIAEKELTKIDEKKIILEKANFDKMYEWLKVHQNKNTGLIMSFEGDKDIANWSFTYDAALVIQAYARFGDPQRAKKILDFFAHDAKRENGWFLNAYYVNDGSPAEFIMHSGPNIWLGIAIMQYMQVTQDKSYLSLAESIASTIIKFQNQDAGGGIQGGPTANWYSTEHNLDAYAFYKMLLEITGKKIYSQAADKTLNWIVENTYNRQDLPIKRGKGDSTIATDTYAWSIAAIGPEKLKKIGMDPDKILEFVEENCSIEVDFVKPDAKRVKIKGFDFAPQQHAARGGVISSEWTAQMVVSYKIMSDYYARLGDKTRADEYKKKADMYLNELGNMIISSSSASGQGEGCLPYATQEHVDTGHGWMTPKGSRTGSVSGTAYTLFAYYGFNPLQFE